MRVRVCVRASLQFDLGRRTMFPCCDVRAHEGAARPAGGAAQPAVRALGGPVDHHHAGGHCLSLCCARRPVARDTIMQRSVELNILSHAQAIAAYGSAMGGPSSEPLLSLVRPRLRACVRAWVRCVRSALVVHGVRGRER